MKKRTYIPFKNKAVKEIFKSYSNDVRQKLMELRELILNVANENDEVGEIEETLKWNQPSYLSQNPKSGTTIRIGNIKSNSELYGMYFHCQTSMISTIKQIYPDEFTYEGNRAIVFSINRVYNKSILEHCITLAHTYHNKK